MPKKNKILQQLEEIIKNQTETTNWLEDVACQPVALDRLPYTLDCIWNDMMAIKQKLTKLEEEIKNNDN